MTNSTILVTGGAGYIGSHTVLQLRARGERVVILDDLSRGFRQAVLDTQLVVGKVGSIEVAVMQGRVHFYEGYTAKEVVFPMRVLGRLGIRSAILTNAAGGIDLGYKQGALVVIRDHINLQGANPLIGPNDDRFGPRFPSSAPCCRPLGRGGGFVSGVHLEHGRLWLGCEGKSLGLERRILGYASSKPCDSGETMLHVSQRRPAHYGGDRGGRK